jgi:ketosteroid isomerase-like protein
MSTKEILDRHLNCFGSGDLEGILADYASDVIMFTPKGPLRGRESLRPMFQSLFAEFAKPGAMFSMRQQTVEGEYAYLFWDASTADKVYEACSDLMVVRGGKIIAHSFAGKITDK